MEYFVIVDSWMSSRSSLLVSFCTPQPLHIYLVLLITKISLMCLAVSYDAMDLISSPIIVNSAVGSAQILRVGLEHVSALLETLEILSWQDSLCLLHSSLTLPSAAQLARHLYVSSDMILLTLIDSCWSVYRRALSPVWLESGKES